MPDIDQCSLLAAKGRLEKAQTEAKALAWKAREAVAEAKNADRTARAPYREACRKAGVAREYEGGRSRALPAASG